MSAANASGTLIMQARTGPGPTRRMLRLREKHSYLAPATSLERTHRRVLLLPDISKSRMCLQKSGWGWHEQR